MREDLGRLLDEAGVVVAVAVEEPVESVPESVRDAVIAGKAEVDKDDGGDDDVDDVDDELDRVVNVEEVMLVLVEG
jgi:hypothetical protein